MKFLVYGGKGWIGQMVVKYLEQLDINYICGTSRVDNTEDLLDEINEVNPTHIICLIGRTHGKIGDKVYPTIDYLEQKGKIYENVRDNLFSPISLALICSMNDIHLTYLGTGCIFTYDQNHEVGSGNTFTEDDNPNFFDSGYSVVKGFTDRLMHLFSDKVLNLRIRMPIVSEPCPRNFITKIVNYEKICSMFNSMTVLDELIPVALDMATNNNVGTVNLVNPGVISHDEILELYRDIVDPNFTWKNFNYEEQMEILAAGRSNNHLDTTQLEQKYDVMNIKDSIKTTLERMRDKEYGFII